MTEQKLAAIMAKQIPNDEKRQRADFIVDTSQGFEHARAQVRDILARIATMPNRKR
jgi:dephospho-CoA kinase